MQIKLEWIINYFTKIAFFSILFLSLPSAIENQYIIIFSNILILLIMILIISYKNFNINFYDLFLFFIFLCVAIITAYRDIIRPFEAINLVMLYIYFIYYCHREYLIEEIWPTFQKIFLFINYFYLAYEIQTFGYQSVLIKGFSSIFFERGMLGIFGLLFALQGSNIYKILWIPLLLISGSVFGLISSILIICILLKNFIILQTSSINKLLIFSCTLILGLTFIFSSSFKDLENNASILNRLQNGNYGNINTRSLDRQEYKPVLSFYENPGLSTIFLGIGNREVSSGVTSNKLAEMGLLSFAILKLFELYILLRIFSLRHSGSKKQLAFLIPLWIALNYYVFFTFYFLIFVLIGRLFYGFQKLQ